MKRLTILTVVIVAMAFFTHANIAIWKITPAYDSVQLLENGLLKVSQNKKAGLLNSQGSVILPLEYDSIGPFNENKALLYNGSAFVGFVDVSGKKYDVESSYTLVPGMEYFSDGFIPVKKNGSYYYLDVEGNISGGPFAEVRPFVNGFAAVATYKDLIKKTNETHCIYIEKNNLTTAPIREYGKADFLKKEDISFVSTFRNGRAVYIYKNKAYFLTSSLVSTPIATDSLQPKKTLIQFDKNSVIAPFEDGYLLRSKTGYFYFNKNMQLDKIEDSGINLYIYNEPEVKKVEKPTEITTFGVSGALGIKYKGEVVLPEQFDDVIPIAGKFAFVKSEGKWGVVEIDTDDDFIIKLNNEENIGFTHRYFNTKLEVSMPSYVKSKDVVIVPQSNDCELLIGTRQEIDKRDRNSLVNECRLSIPKELSDTLLMKEYVFNLQYNGFTTVDYRVTVPEWYVKYYEVKFEESKYTINPTEVITVEFELAKTVADNSNYFKQVELVIPEVGKVPLHKITETRYAFRIGNINRDKLSFVINISEVGCPVIEYPFEMTFVKTNPKKADSTIDVTISQVMQISNFQLTDDVQSSSSSSSGSSTIPVITLP